jgi:hypothetical protein
MAVKEPILLGDHPRYEIRMGASAFKHFYPAVFTIVAVFALNPKPKLEKPHHPLINPTYVGWNLSRFRNCENMKIKKGIAACIKSRSQISRARPSRAEQSPC